MLLSALWSRSAYLQLNLTRDQLNMELTLEYFSHILPSCISFLLYRCCPG